MATGEETDAETLGGADMHSRISGVSDHLAEDEYTAIEKVREFIKYMGWSKKAALPPASLSLVKEPLYEVGSILGIIPSDIKLPLDSMEVIKHIVDGSDFSDFKPLYGIHIVTGWAHIHGFPVGIIANNNPIFPEDANKAVQFIQLCNMRNTPILFLQNITGFMVGKKYESDGIIKAGARFINAVTNSKVPAITVVMGCSYGAGNYAMCGRAYGPRFLFSWPGSKCSVMGPDQLTGVMDIIARDSAKKLGKTLDEDVMNTRKDMFRGLVEAESDVYYTSSRLLDDAVIDPRDTRDVLGMCLCVIHGNEVSGGNLYGISRM
jgi:acetyl-CoA carboxylase carboxyltransferase component